MGIFKVDNGYARLPYGRPMRLRHIEGPVFVVRRVGLSPRTLIRTGKDAPGKRRPRAQKDGTYAKPGSDFDGRCGEYGDTQIDWSSNLISGGEEGCKIAKPSDSAPDSIRLDVVCTSADREGQRYKEIIVLKKIDEKTIFIRETQDGKFKRPGGRMAYCPDKLQRSYKENNRKS